LPDDGQLLGESEAVEAENSHLDPQLQLLIQAWPTLSREIVNGGPKVRRGAAQKCGTRVQEYPAFRRESRVSFNLWFDAA